jgi:stage II sporulation protein M
MKKRSKKKNFFKKNILDSWEYIKDSKRFILITFFIFLILCFIGFLIPAPEQVSQQILKYIEELLEKTKDMGLFELMWFIFWNNLKVSFLGMISGVFLGIIPLFFAITNGYIIGFVSFLVANENGFLNLWRLLPHGIFELPAVFISLGLGVKIGMFPFCKQKVKTLKYNLKESFRVLFFIVIPLLIIAAIIESSLIFLFQ